MEEDIEWEILIRKEEMERYRNKLHAFHITEILFPWREFSCLVNIKLTL